MLGLGGHADMNMYWRVHITKSISNYSQRKINKLFQWRNEPRDGNNTVCEEYSMKCLWAVGE